MRGDWWPRVRQSFAIVGAVLLEPIVFATVPFTPPARAAEPASPSVKIDASKLPTVAIEAHNITMPDLMKELSNSLHFTVEGLPTLDGQDRVSLSSKGNLEDILRGIILLPGKGPVTFYNGKMIDRIVIVGLNAGGSNSQSVRPSEAETQTQPEGTTTTPPLQ